MYISSSFSFLAKNRICHISNWVFVKPAYSDLISYLSYTPFMKVVIHKFIFFLRVCQLHKIIRWICLQLVIHSVAYYDLLVNFDRSWCFFFLLQPGIQVLFPVIHIHLRKSFVMTLSHQLTLGEDRHLVYSSLGQKKLWSMEFLLEWSTVTHACFTALPVVHIAPFATIVWSGLITIVLGWVNALGRYTDWCAPYRFIVFRVLLCSLDNYWSFFFPTFWKSHIMTLTAFSMWTSAAQLPILLFICFIFNASLHIRVCHVSLVHQVSDGWLSRNSLDGNEAFARIRDTNGLLFYFTLVCWWTHWISFVPHKHKSGQLISNSLYLKLSDWIYCGWFCHKLISVTFSLVCPNLVH